MNVLIILNGELKSPAFLKKLADNADYIICADGGFDKAKAASVTPDLLLGDMDSVQTKGINVKTQKYPAEKDWTDCELALHSAVDMQADEIVVTCALGGRCDHEMANLYVLSDFTGACIKEPDVSIYVCDSVLSFGGKGKTFSVLPVCNSYVTISGAKYPVQNTLFRVGSSLGVSNEIVQDVANVTVHQGKCLVFVNEM
ncbi:MAG: thiamine diphosphokinase [Clostridia bacterium]|nr:thiamine diphosphokinase [Clostridia bacterium]